MRKVWSWRENIKLEVYSLHGVFIKVLTHRSSIYKNHFLLKLHHSVFWKWCSFYIWPQGGSVDLYLLWDDAPEIMFSKRQQYQNISLSRGPNTREGDRQNKSLKFKRTCIESHDIMEELSLFLASWWAGQTISLVHRASGSGLHGDGAKAFP